MPQNLNLVNAEFVCWLFLSRCQHGGLILERNTNIPSLCEHCSDRAAHCTAVDVLCNCPFIMRTVWVRIVFQLFRRGAVFLLLLVHMLPFTMLLGSMLAFFLLMSGLVRLILVRLVHPSFS